jgi:hypothetical protein
MVEKALKNVWKNGSPHKLATLPDKTSREDRENR